MQVSPQITRLVARGATFVVNHSGGKDSQAMYLFIRSVVPASQIVVVHAELPGVDWDGIEAHIRSTIDHPLLVCKARRTFLQMVEERGMFPSPSQRQCTSDLKRGPIEKTIRHTGKSLIVNCMGLRAEESSARAKAEPFKYSERNSKAGREWYDWLPIHHWTVAQVFATIHEAGQEAHWAYAAGMSRLSCCFCIMSSKADLITAAKLKPTLYKTYVALEQRLGVTMMMPKKGVKLYLTDITGIAA